MPAHIGDLHALLMLSNDLLSMHQACYVNAMVVLQPCPLHKKNTMPEMHVALS